MRTVYGVKYMKEKVEIEVMGTKADLTLSWADGMIGAIAVFDSRDKALKYAEDEKYIFEVVIE